MPGKPRGHRNTGGVSVSIPGLLAVMAGLTIFYLYWVLRWGTHIQSGVSKLVLLGSGVLLIIWGAHEIALGTFLSFRGRRKKKRVDDEFDLPPPSRKLAIVIALGLMAAGIGFGTLMVLRAEESLTVVVGIIVGIFVFVTGLRRFTTALQKDESRATVRRHQHLTPLGAAYLAIMVTFMTASLLGRSNMLMLMFALMAGPFVINGGITLRMLRQTSIARKLPSRAMAGDVLDISLIISNDKRVMSASIIDCIDRISGQGEELQTGVLFARVPPRSSRAGTYRFRPMQRGRYRFGPLAISSRFPLGFVERGLRFAARDEMIVYPRIGRLSPEWNRDVRTATELVESEHARFGIYEDEFHRLREHRWGDNPRAIHWRTSARRNELMVREYQQNRDRDLVVLLDLWAPEKPGEDDLERVELAVSFAATVCVEQMQQSREARVTLISAGRKLKRWDGQAGEMSFDSLLSMLALVKPGRAKSPEELVQESPAVNSPATRVILLTTSADRLPAAGSEGRDIAGLETYIADWNQLGGYFDLPAAAGAEGGRL